MHIGHLLEAHCRDGLAEFGLHHGQARVLMALAREGELIQARLADGLEIAPATLSIMLKKLLDRGLVKRTPDAADVRAYRISLTPAGREAVERVKQVWGQAYQTIIDAVEVNDRELMHGRLLKIRNALGGRSPEL
jgi:DNA-binding MarR family transcriptional regulator